MKKQPEIQRIHETLKRKLAKKGLMPVEIMRLIRDVINIAADRRSLTLAGMNMKLNSLGWDRYIVDESVFELLVFCIENGGVKDIRPADKPNTRNGGDHEV